MNKKFGEVFNKGLSSSIEKNESGQVVLSGLKDASLKPHPLQTSLST
ncbi:hypothetical protein P872_16190 [Rhodonellum psychrophilum GCM71 = DSM 17998]|uniref:Uncharacterized protein n=1 Tax=Rhodonellum psychrophilum GCM71 = DSM 17998 TaxID=1123057 RepID=U5BZY9_9BACT|nr:hypothetical protein P872_16190 [Rhodonellum psychrophilum GCM71 = DSM 17998]